MAEQCDELRAAAEPGSEDLTEGGTIETDPVPGVMTQACELVGTL